METNRCSGTAGRDVGSRCRVPRGVRMPGIFGYCGWAVAFLIPVFILATFVFFR